MHNPAARPFRFGAWAEHAFTGEALLETAQRLEGHGFSMLLLRDHLVEGPFPHQFAPLTALAFVAAHTTSLRVGTLVISNDFRYPALLAKEVATLDVLSGGRVELGIGAGFLRREYAAAGIRFDSAADRVARLEDSLRVLKCRFADKAQSFPVPVQQPHPPILIAGARRRMLMLAGREADIVALQAVSTTSGDVVDTASARLAERVAEQIGWVREVAGERWPELELSTSATVIYAEDRLAAATELVCRRGWSDVTPEEVLDMPSIFIGSLETVVELFQERRARYGLSYFVTSDLAIETLAPVVARLAGA
jgi:probable F420-dependent oxidoreductase